MTGRSWRSGEDVVSTRLPGDAYVEASSGIWKLAKLLVPRQLDNAIAHSTVSAAPYRVGWRAVEPSIKFGGVDPVTDKPAVAHYICAVSDIEPFDPIADSELWSWRSIRLDASNETVAFGYGWTIMSPEGITECGDQPPEDHMRTKGLAWRRARRLTEGNDDDFETILATISIMALDIESPEAE